LLFVRDINLMGLVKQYLLGWWNWIRNVEN
jgi:hypothetical protein